MLKTIYKKRTDLKNALLIIFYFKKYIFYFCQPINLFWHLKCKTEMEMVCTASAPLFTCTLNACALIKLFVKMTCSDVCYQLDWISWLAHL